MISKQSLFITIALHGLLIVLSLFIVYDKIPITLLRQIEIEDFGIANTQKTIPTKSSSSPLSQPKKSFGEIAVPEKVDLPKTNIKYDNSLDKISPTSKEIIAQSTINELSDIQTQNEQIVTNNTNFQELSDNNDDVFSNQSFLENLSSKIESDSRKSSHLKIEGEVANRKILNSELPKYPDNIQEQEEIKLKFVVDSNGNVISTIVMKKGNEQLEKLSMEALKKWKFNTISNQVNQTGFITFVFELR